jgi:hypothetical protein
VNAFPIFPKNASPVLTNEEESDLVIYTSYFLSHDIDEDKQDILEAVRLN